MLQNCCDSEKRERRRERERERERRRERRRERLLVASLIPSVLDQGGEQQERTTEKTCVPTIHPSCLYFLFLFICSLSLCFVPLSFFLLVVSSLPPVSVRSRVASSSSPLRRPRRPRLSVECLLRDLCQCAWLSSEETAHPTGIAVRSFRGGRRNPSGRGAAYW